MKKESIIPSTGTSALIFIDMQERLVNAMPETISGTIESQKILLQAASLLGLKTIITEQYPKGLGYTTEELSSLFSSDWKIIEKNTFSSMQEPAVRAEISNSPVKTIILAGIETHVCVLQTAIDCIESGYQTILIADAVNSRKESDKLTALRTAESCGIQIMSVESLIFMLMRDSKHPEFKNISKLLK